MKDDPTSSSAKGASDASPPARETKVAADPTGDSFEQLSLDATVVGPGMRTEDHYEPGAKLKIKGERGVFVYKRASVSKSGLVSLHLAGENGTRAVRPDQVVLVRKRTSRARSG